MPRAAARERRPSAERLLPPAHEAPPPPPLLNHEESPILGVNVGRRQRRSDLHQRRSDLHQGSTTWRRVGSSALFRGRRPAEVTGQAAARRATRSPRASRRRGKSADRSSSAAQGQLVDASPRAWTKRKRAEALGIRPFRKNPGDVLLSHTASRAVPSAPKSLTSEFGMGSGVASSKSSPETLGRKNHVGPVVVGSTCRPVVCTRTRNPNPAREGLDGCLRDMAKPHDLLVLVSSLDCSNSTPSLSTSWSTRGL